MALWVFPFNSFGYIFRSEIATSCGDSMFNFLTTHHTVFHKGYTMLYIHQQWTSVPIFAHPYQHLLVCVLIAIVKCEETPHCGSGFTFLTGY